LLTFKYGGGSKIPSLLQCKMIGEFDLKTITKQDKNITITITYNNKPSKDAIRNYANKLKQIIDSKMIAS
jgi:hypothetical protein